MEKEELAPHVSEIARVLGGKIEESEIWKELDTYLNHYRVSLETAKRGIVKKFGGDPSALTRGVRKPIQQLGLNEQSVDILARVVTVNPKDVEVDGKPKSILCGILGDESGTIPYTAWDADRLPMQKGEVVLIRNAYTKEWGGQPQVNLGNRASIEPQPADAVKLQEGAPRAFPDTGEVKISQLSESIGGVTVTARVLSIEKREVEVSGEKRIVFSGIMADETGKVQFSAWYDFELKRNDLITIRGAYVRSWCGIPQLNLGERSQVTRPSVKFPTGAELAEAKVRSIGDMEKVGGGVDVLVRGTVVEVRKGSGLIFRCPECNRVVQKNACRVHGNVQASPDLRIKAVVDDGYATMTAVMNRKMTESIMETTLDDSLRLAKEAMNPDVIRERIDEKLFAQPVEVTGNVTSDEYGLMMIVSDARITIPEVRGEASALLTRLEGSS
ncbi:MAG: DNA-binding protein [Methanomassiliicoccales archaeon]|jgi:replication factor A1